MPTLIDHALLAIACLGVPVYALFAWRRLRARIRAGEPRARTEAYRGTILVEWTLTAAALAAWVGLARPLGELGLRIGSGWRFWSLAAVTLLVVVVLWRQWRTASPAVVLAVAVFGLCHAYQGGAGIAKTAALGLIGALVYVGSGSLLPAIALHVAVDVHGGLLGWRVLGEGTATDQGAPTACGRT